METVEGMDVEKLALFFENIQNSVCQKFSSSAGGAFQPDKWKNDKKVAGKIHGRGSTNFIVKSEILEKAAANFSIVRGNKLPAAAGKNIKELEDAPFVAMGVSVITHPHNPNIPTSHANVRLFVTKNKSGKEVWWFGGGFDLTPYLPFKEDAVYWHQSAMAVCQKYGKDIYKNYKNWCDTYFFLPHREETRGVGGLFFDELSGVTCKAHGWNEGFNFGTGLNFIEDLMEVYSNSYCKIIEKRRNQPFNTVEKEFQIYRRGRYVEFNLLYDRGTIFGIQSKGRTESILISLPPQVSWTYKLDPKFERLQKNLKNYLKPLEWVK